ncbi:MAG TPA: hypothetical protein VHH35_04875, partial [Pyrinomonadaceae bacterium]|nr:hypothetical protein [Pyrinomonadaceae bacterium]
MSSAFNHKVYERINVAAAANGGVATASSSRDEDKFPAASVIDGDRTGLNWSGGGGWADGTPGAFPDTIEIQFVDEVMIDEINVITLQDAWWSPIEPLETTNFFNNGITSFEVQFWDGASWVTIPGGTVTGNTKVWRRFTFSPVPTEKIRVRVNAAKSTHSILVELEAFGVLPEMPAPSPSPSPFPQGDIAPHLAERDIFIDASNNVGFGTANPIFNDDGTTGAFVGKWVAIDGKVSGAAAYLGIGGSIPQVNERVGGLNFYNMAMGGVDNRTATIFSFNGPTLGTGNLEFYTSPSIIGPVR